jgi:hypothetical protein
MPMVPTGGVESQVGFGPSGADQLGTGGYAGADMQGAGDPTDPNAPLNLDAMAPMEPTSIAEALQQALEERQQALQAQQQQESQQLLMSDLQQADAFIQEMMSMLGQEATTADGGGQLPPAPGMDPQGAPGGPGMAEAMTGVGSPLAPGEDLTQLMGA